MKLKTVPLVLVLLALVAVAPTLQAQKTGFMVAIAPPTPPTPPPPPPTPAIAVKAPVQQFTSAPVQPIRPQQQPTGFGFGVMPPITPPIITTSWSPIFNQTVVIPNATVIVQQPRTQGVQTPAIGATKQQVLQQFGYPLTNVLSYGGETLYFTGGLTVFLQNDKVVRVQRPN